MENEQYGSGRPHTSWQLPNSDALASLFVRCDIFAWGLREQELVAICRVMHKLITARRVHSELAALRRLAATRRAFVHRERRLVATPTRYHHTVVLPPRQPQGRDYAASR